MKKYKGRNNSHNRKQQQKQYHRSETPLISFVLEAVKASPLGDLLAMGLGEPA